MEEVLDPRRNQSSKMPMMMVVQQITMMRKLVTKDAKRYSYDTDNEVHGLDVTIVGDGITFLVLALVFYQQKRTIGAVLNVNS